MTRLTYTDQDLLDYSEEHLLYELNILKWVAETISKTSPSFQLSAYLESFVIHLRGLIDFLYTLPKDVKNADDVIAADFYDPSSGWNPGALSTTLTDARIRANKEVGHITFKRKKGMHPDKPWPVSALFNEILSVIRKFATGASANKLHSKVVEWSKSDDVKMMSLAVNASTTSTNTAMISFGTSVFGPLPTTPTLRRKLP